MRLRKRLILAAITGTFMACAGIYWISNRSDNQLTNFFIIVFTVLTALLACFQWLLPFSSENHNTPASNATMQESRASSYAHSSRTRHYREQSQPKEPIQWYEWVQIVYKTFLDVLESREANMLIYPIIGLIPASVLYMLLLIMGLDKTSLGTILFLSVFIIVGGMAFLADYTSTLIRTIAEVRAEKRQARLQQRFL